jgi:hypothetical protein
MKSKEEHFFVIGRLELASPHITLFVSQQSYDGYTRGGITASLEYQSVRLSLRRNLVPTSSPHLLPRKRLYLPSWSQRGGATLACG